MPRYPAHAMTGRVLLPCVFGALLLAGCAAHEGGDDGGRAADLGALDPSLTLGIPEPWPALSGNELSVSGELSFGRMPMPPRGPQIVDDRDAALLDWMRLAGFVPDPPPWPPWPSPDPIFRWTPMPWESESWPGTSSARPLDPASVEHLLLPDDSVGRWIDE